MPCQIVYLLTRDEAQRHQYRQAAGAAETTAVTKPSTSNQRGLTPRRSSSRWMLSGVESSPIITLFSCVPRF
jgi:hypothetical protein